MIPVVFTPDTGLLIWLQQSTQQITFLSKTERKAREAKSADNQQLGRKKKTRGEIKKEKVRRWRSSLYGDPASGSKWASDKRRNDSWGEQKNRHGSSYDTLKLKCTSRNNCDQWILLNRLLLDRLACCVAAPQLSCSNHFIFIDLLRMSSRRDHLKMCAIVSIFTPYWVFSLSATISF